MKKKIALFAISVFYALFSHVSLAECTTNRNVDILITRPDSRYTDNLDGTVTDNETRLMWQKCTIGQNYNKGNDALGSADDTCDGAGIGMNWKDALVAANENTLYGYNDWFLPNKNQLKSLIETACHSPSINESLFPNTPSGYYWSSSPYDFYYSNYAWAVGFNTGYDYTRTRDIKSLIRLVREIQ